MDVATAVRTAAARRGRFTIKRVDCLEDYRACEALQDRIWGPGDIVGVPLLDLLTAQDNGGMVLGAYDSGDTVVGFVYSMLGLSESRQLKHCSVLLAVAPECQGQGLGYRLKMAQRAAALGQDIDLVTWTFDPLLSRNAHLNIAKLGAVSTSYLIDVYGPGDGLNAGLETDRLFVEWRLMDPPGRLGPASAARARPVNTVREDARGLPCCASIDTSAGDPILSVHIPPDIAVLKGMDLGLAVDWRRSTRELFLHYFERGYQVCDFSYDRRTEGATPAYILLRTNHLEEIDARY